MEERIRDSHVVPEAGAARITCAACLSRREFLGQSALAAATVAFLAACGDGDIGGSGITSPIQPVTVTVASVAGLATIGKLVNISPQIAAKRTGAGTFAAFSRACTHAGTQIDLFQTGFLCSNHLSQFDNNGQVTIGPAARNLDKLTATYDAATDKLTIS